MIPEELKREFGRVLCFSGGVDEQDLLPHGSPEEVRQAVLGKDVGDELTEGLQVAGDDREVAKAQLSA